MSTEQVQNHTPGPWSFEGYFPDGEWGIEAGKGSPILSVEQGGIGSFLGNQSDAQLIAIAPQLLEENDALKAERDALAAKVADLERLMFCWGGVRINGHILELFISDDDQYYILGHVWDEPDHHGNYVSNRIIDRSAQDFQFSKIYRDLIDAARAEAGTEAKSG